MAEVIAEELVLTDRVARTPTRIEVSVWEGSVVPLHSDFGLIGFDMATASLQLAATGFPVIPLPSPYEPVPLIANPNVLDSMPSASILPIPSPVDPFLDRADLFRTEISPTEWRGQPDAFNCHSWSFNGGGIDLDEDPRVAAEIALLSSLYMEIALGSPRWNQSAIDDIAAGTVLDEHQVPQIGDVVVYAFDSNNDGMLTEIGEAPHSAIVTRVEDGIVTQVESKFGSAAPIRHQPNDPFATNMGQTILIVRPAQVFFVP